MVVYNMVEGVSFLAPASRLETALGKASVKRTEPVDILEIEISLFEISPFCLQFNCLLHNFLCKAYDITRKTPEAQCGVIKQQLESYKQINIEEYGGSGKFFFFFSWECPW